MGVAGCIYGVPCNATAVLKVDPATDTVSLLGGPLPGVNKWYGGIIGGDNCIYGIPQCGDCVLKIDGAAQASGKISAAAEKKAASISAAV